ncbi:hypothetical protein [Rosistilla oblonga]|nr:hypothetical protein [Rosistilla oblonga]
MRLSHLKNSVVGESRRNRFSHSSSRTVSGSSRTAQSMLRGSTYTQRTTIQRWQSGVLRMIKKAMYTVALATMTIQTSSAKGPCAPRVGCGCSQPVSVVSGCSSSSSNIVHDNPSELNILLTTELVALRKEVAELKTAAAETSQALEQAETLVGTQKSRMEQLIADSLKETKRAEAAEKALKESKAAMAAATKANEQALAKVKQQLADTSKKVEQLTSKNAELSKQIAEENKRKEEEKKRREQAKAKRDEEAMKAKKAAEEKAKKEAEAKKAKMEAEVKAKKEAEAKKAAEAKAKQEAEAKKAAEAKAKQEAEAKKAAEAKAKQEAEAAAAKAKEAAEAKPADEKSDK